MTDLSEIAHTIAGQGVLVVGDIMFDRFVYGDANRISPEGPVPVLAIARTDEMLGGAGNVMANLAGLRARGHLVAVTGGDDTAARVRELARELGDDGEGLVSDPDRPTSVKTRYIARTQQLLRADFEKTHPVSDAVARAIVEAVRKKIPFVRAVILSDYGKGVLRADVIKDVIALAAKAGVPVLVDPKGSDYSKYKGATVVTPNKKELSEATGGMPTETDSDVIAAAQALIKSSGIGNVVATRAQDGMSVIRGKGASFESPVHLRAEAREVFDVSGAGDTVIATVAAALAAGASLTEAAALANIAGGIVVGKVGTAAIRAEEIAETLERKEFALHTAGDGSVSAVERAHQGYVCTREEAAEQVRKWRARGLCVGFTNGCFDILHSGHVTYLNQARGKCDRLVLALNTDASVRLLKGPDRPVNPEAARATVMAALGAIDMVVFFGAEKEGEDNTPRALIAELQPDVFFKGGDYTVETLPEAKTVQSYGGKIILLPFQEGFSTTGTINKLKGKAA